MLSAHDPYQLCSVYNYHGSWLCQLKLPFTTPQSVGGLGVWCRRRPVDGIRFDHCSPLLRHLIVTSNSSISPRRNRIFGLPKGAPKNGLWGYRCEFDLDPKIERPKPPFCEDLPFKIVVFQCQKVSKKKFGNWPSRGPPARNAGFCSERELRLHHFRAFRLDEMRILAF